MISFNTGVFRARIRVYIGEEEWGAFTKLATRLNWDVPASNKDILGEAISHGMWLRERKLDTLVHESVHVAQYLCEYLGIDDKEVIAYMAEYIVAKVQKWIKGGWR